MNRETESIILVSVILIALALVFFSTLIFGFFLTRKRYRKYKILAQQYHLKASRGFLFLIPQIYGKYHDYSLLLKYSLGSKTMAPMYHLTLIYPAPLAFRFGINTKTLISSSTIKSGNNRFDKLFSLYSPQPQTLLKFLIPRKINALLQISQLYDYSLIMVNQKQVSISIIAQSDEPFNLKKIFDLVKDLADIMISYQHRPQVNT